jgi:hypothetical protein
MKTLYLLLTLLFAGTAVEGQISNMNVGGSLNLGSIQGNSEPVSSFGGTLFFDFFPWFEHDVSFRFAYSYSQKVEYFLPEDRAGKYYPLLKILSLKGFIRQDISFPVYIEEGAGLIYLNDRTLANVNEWEAGTTFAAAVGIDFRKIGATGILISLGLDYGISFMKTNATYYYFSLQSQYYF